MFLCTMQPKTELYLSKVGLELREHWPCFVSHVKMHLGSITIPMLSSFMWEIFPTVCNFCPLSVHVSENSFFSGTD